ncbi:MAG: hypothetical protein WBG48_03725 [Pricia sp.]
MKKTLLLLTLFLVVCSCSKDEDNQTKLPKELNFTGTIVSCSDFTVHQILDAKNLNISLDIDGTGREDLNLTSEFKSFSLPNDNLKCNISAWDAPIAGNFCNDVIIREVNLTGTWNAVSGNLKLSVSDIEETEFDTYYRLTILLENVIFENSNGDEQREIPSLIIEETGVGFIPG